MVPFLSRSSTFYSPQEIFNLVTFWLPLTFFPLLGRPAARLASPHPSVRNWSQFLVDCTPPSGVLLFMIGFKSFSFPPLPALTGQRRLLHARVLDVPGVRFLTKWGFLILTQNTPFYPPPGPGPGLFFSVFKGRSPSLLLSFPLRSFDISLYPGHVLWKLVLFASGLSFCATLF